MAPPGNQAANGEDKAQPAHREKPAYSPDLEAAREHCVVGMNHSIMGPDLTPIPVCTPAFGASRVAFAIQIFRVVTRVPIEEPDDFVPLLERSRVVYEIANRSMNRR